MSSVYEREKRGKARGIVEIVAQTTSPDYKLRRTVIPVSHITAKRKRSKVDKTKRERERAAPTLLNSHPVLGNAFSRVLMAVCLMIRTYFLVGEISCTLSSFVRAFSTEQSYPRFLS